MRQTLKPVGLAILLTLGLSACGTMTKQDKSTAIGAGIGAVAGSVLTDGGTLGTLGGAAIGGMIGHQMGKEDDAKKEDESKPAKKGNSI